jgi:hypothetical protein
LILGFPIESPVARAAPARSTRASPFAMNHSALGHARLLGDVGGANAHFAWEDVPGAPLRDLQVLSA